MFFTIFLKVIVVLYLKFRICHGFAMDVICSTAFGIHIDSQENPNNQFIMMAKQMTSLKFSNPMFMLQGKYSEFLLIYLFVIYLFILIGLVENIKTVSKR